jgi:hypothetical protein
MLTITGIFKERSVDPKAEYVRAFQRTIMIVPKDRSIEGSALCIANDMLHVNNASPEQSRKAFKTLFIPKPMLMTIPSASQEMTPEQQKIDKMVQALMQHTKMNLEWSRKCLLETNFDYEHACHAFNVLSQQNQIPREAFAMEEAMQE